MLTIPGYQINEQLYESAHSLVCRGQRERDKQPVILKLLKDDYPTPEELARFRREYEMTCSLNVDGVINVYALEPYKNSLVMVLEDFGGESLTRLLKERTIGLSEFLPLAIRIAEIVGAVHHRHIMHKDINPSNLVWNPETDELKIIDFGISTELSREQPEIRNPNVLEGTLAYMSPEQTGRMNRAMDYRTDLYSLGVTFYHLLTGQPPFQAEDAMELVHCHLAKMPVPPCEIIDNSQFPIRNSQLSILSDIIMKLLAKNVEDRYQSAYGLKADVEYVLKTLSGFETLSGFTLAQHDFSERFQIPQKLYGREQENSTLLAAFDRVGKGATELMRVTGYAGIGKSALVHEIHKPITEKRGYFISGKFDQFQRNIPYSALIQAFQGFMRQLLTEPEDQLAMWKEKLLQAVGPNGQVIIDVIPDVELIIGQQSEVPELPPNQAQNRFNLVFQNFVRTCAAKEHPLVIFLDDLQWADRASLNLLQLFMTDARTQHMLIIGAYRDNEVNDAHPVMLTLGEVQKAGAAVEMITLKPLGLEHVEQLVAETLHISKPDRSSKTCQVSPFAELLLQKTGGNPFFLRQFLHALYEDELVELDVNNGVWRWDLEAIQQRRMTDNVVELMTSKIQKLSEETQHVLKLAACIGNQFDLQSLSIVHGKSPADTLRELWDTLQEVLIVPLDDSYKYVKNVETEDSRITHHVSRFTFLHDRIQQAAYSLIEEEHKQEIHLKIGRLLLANAPETEREEHIFDIVNHLNLGKDLITAQPEKDELAQLNLTAGRKAKASAACQAAFGYLRAGRELLAVDSWQRQYDLTLALSEAAAEAAYLSGDFEEMEQLAEIVLQHAGTLLDKVKVYEVKIQAYIAQNKLLEAVEMGLQILKLLGIRFPEKPATVHILLALVRTKLILTGKRIEDLIDLPEMTDPYNLAVMRILMIISPATYLAVPELFPLTMLKAVNLSVKHGNTAVSAFAYACYGLILCGIVGDIDSGYRFGKLALSVLERFNARELKANTLFIVNNFIRHWKEHAREVSHSLLEVYQSALDTGNFEYAGYSAATYSVLSTFAGKELSELEAQIAQLSDTLVRVRQETTLHYSKIYWQAVRNLVREADSSLRSPCRLIGEAYDEEKMQPLHRKVNDKTALSELYSNKLLLCYLFQVYPQAVENAVLTETYLDAVVGQVTVPLFHFYDSLARLAVYPDASRSEQRRILKKVTASQKKIKKWAHHAPMNYLHKWHLVEAERARVFGKDVEAMAYYDKAIEGAKENEYLHEEALANEVAARFYLERGRKQIARIYMQEARYCYLKWGARAKMKHLDETYADLLAARDGRHPLTGSGHRLAGGAHLTLTKTPSTGTRSSELDISTLMKASQTMSGEMVLADLLEKMMRIVIENAGAQQGFFMLGQEGKWEIAMEGTPTDDGLHFQSGVHLEEQDGRHPSTGSGHRLEGGAHRTPVSIINYAIRTQETVVLHDASQEGNFTHDPYILEHQPKSVLCFPLLNQGKLTGILYLENNLTAGAFTPDRLEVLNLLSSQMAISIENATLYRNVEDTLNQQIELTTAYSRFVPREFLSFLQKERITDVQLGDQVEQEMTILFSDIRDFTTLSENMSPQENFNFINSYLSRMEPIILDHQGFIDKYIGDAIMALFPTTADDAVQAGIAMLHRIRGYNQERHNAGYLPIRIGVGLNTGCLMLGTVGSAHRMDGTVISNAVNVASRIEGLTKIYGASIVISENTLSCLKDQSIYHTRFLGKVQVKGKHEAVSVFEVYDGDPEEIITLKLKTTSDFEEGLSLYLAKEFAEAAVCFKQVLKANRDDKTADLYLKRSAQFMVQGVPENWDGVESLEHK